jgi:mono/diheme cytochrome c family protein
MQKRLVSGLFILLALFGLAAAVWGQSSCVACHGDAETMKKLVAPPTALSSEGEG